MELKSLRVERRKSGRLDVQLQLSTNRNKLQGNSSHVARIRPNLKALRQILGMTQEQFATMAGVSQPQVCKVEMGIHSPGIKLLKHVKAVSDIARQILAGQETKENSRLLKNGEPVPALDTVFAEAHEYVSMIRLNLRIGNPALQGLPEKVIFRYYLKPNLTDSDVEEALSNVLGTAKPSKTFTRRVLRAASQRFESQKEGCKL